MRIVSNTGPIIGLAKIGKVGLLKSLAQEVLIPPFVQKELFGKIGSETVQIENALDEFIRLRQNTLQLAAGMNGGANRVEAC